MSRRGADEEARGGFLADCLLAAVQAHAELARRRLRCRELDLRAPGSERKLVINFTILLTAKTMHALFGPSRRKWTCMRSTPGGTSSQRR